jgi:hypothetical protein
VIRRMVPGLVALAAVGAVVVAALWWTQEDRGRLVVTGVVVGVQAQGLTDVNGFTVRTVDGQELEFAVGPLENPTQFPPSHLGVHLTDGVPVRVTYRESGSERVAIRLEDAPGGS